jgi:hypothetical protein
MSLAEVRLQEGESLENALRRFKRKVQTEDIIVLAASWVFWFQPVLPPVKRPLFHSYEWKLGQAINAVTGTRRWALIYFL